MIAHLKSQQGPQALLCTEQKAAAAVTVHVDSTCTAVQLQLLQQPLFARLVLSHRLAGTTPGYPTG